ncbi:helix-turn-helix domain-containing protein [bacterium]|nr:helix-turn-helix domain-containing protein [bacterium]MBU1613943.1 helix-turn-helix domain-containing protein [bacterium]
MDILEKLGTRIRALRKGAGFTQLRLAVEADVSENYICLIEKGQRSPSVHTLNRIAKVLGVSLQSLFSFSEEGKTDRCSEEALQELIIFLEDKAPEDIKLATQIVKKIFQKSQK